MSHLPSGLSTTSAFLCRPHHCGCIGMKSDAHDVMVTFGASTPRHCWAFSSVASI
ncbi:MAG: hypothetical protein VKK59_06565 [Vampirovibrionales bacterium]|nr:hypothetical protein [Vampirovibrionales bacterium]